MATIVTDSKGNVIRFGKYRVEDLDRLTIEERSRNCSEVANELTRRVREILRREFGDELENNFGIQGEENADDRRA